MLLSEYAVNVCCELLTEARECYSTGMCKFNEIPWEIVDIDAIFDAMWKNWNNTEGIELEFTLMGVSLV